MFLMYSWEKNHQNHRHYLFKVGVCFFLIAKFYWPWPSPPPFSYFLLYILWVWFSLCVCDRVYWVQLYGKVCQLSITCGFHQVHFLYSIPVLKSANLISCYWQKLFIYLRKNIVVHLKDLKKCTYFTWSASAQIILLRMDGLFILKLDN
jgi:hypothetical protein